MYRVAMSTCCRTRFISYQWTMSCTWYWRSRLDSGLPTPWDCRCQHRLLALSNVAIGSCRIFQVRSMSASRKLRRFMRPSFLLLLAPRHCALPTAVPVWHALSPPTSSILMAKPSGHSSGCRSPTPHGSFASTSLGCRAEPDSPRSDWLWFSCVRSLVFWLFTATRRLESL